MPYGDLIRLGQSKLDADVLNVTILVNARGRDKQAKADRLARELAIAGWETRQEYAERLSDFLTLEEATAMAKAAGEDASLPPVLFADIADRDGHVLSYILHT